MTTLEGVLVPILTPFDEAGQFDEVAFRGHIDWLIDSGVHGIVPAGSTGEALSLDLDEYHRVVETTISQVAGRVPVIAGCSANATRQVLENCAFAEDAGADAIMLVHPFYSLPDEDELEAHYRAVAAAINVPLVIYNNPFTTGVDASPDLLARLSELEPVRYVKESSGDSTRVVRIIEQSNGRMAVLSGSDNQALEHFACGATGWVAGAANVIPTECVELFDLAVRRRDLDGALAQYRRLFPYLHYVEATGKFVQANKVGVELIGRPLGQPRQPLQPLPPHMRSELREALDLARSPVSQAEAARA